MPPVMGKGKKGLLKAKQSVLLLVTNFPAPPAAPLRRGGAWRPGGGRGGRGPRAHNGVPRAHARGRAQADVSPNKGAGRAQGRKGWGHIGAGRRKKCPTC